MFLALIPGNRDDEPVSPTQITLLRLLDSFLQPVPTPFQDRVDYLNNLAGFLASVFLLQAKIAQCAIQQAIGERPPDLNAPTDVSGSSRNTAQAASCALDERLPSVWVALVLLSTSLSSILLNAEQEDDCGVSNKAPEVVTLTRLCYDIISTSQSRSGAGFVEELVGMMVPQPATISLVHPNGFASETLRLLDVFLPRINFGKAKPFRPHSQTQIGKEVVPGQSARQTDAAEFPYLKRDLVRLLGILCHNSKAIQDRVRFCGGLQVVLNLCGIIDERNPCEFLFLDVLVRVLLWLSRGGDATFSHGRACLCVTFSAGTH